MQKLLTVAVLLGMASCVAEAEYRPAPPTLPPHGRVVEGKMGAVRVQCIERPAGKVIWFECAVTNTSHREGASACLHARYDREGWPGWLASKPVCVNGMQPRETQDIATAFTPKWGRSQVDEMCGPRAAQCKLSVEVR